MAKAKWLVTYWEAYSGTYIVDADDSLSKEEVEEMVGDDIIEGRLKNPDNCYDAGCEAKRLSE